jgi:hypothetical protein
LFLRAWSSDIRYYGGNERLRSGGIRSDLGQYDSPNHLRKDGSRRPIAGGPRVCGKQYRKLVEIVLDRRDEDGAEGGRTAWTRFIERYAAR